MSLSTFPFVAVAVASLAATAHADGPVLRSVSQTAPTVVSVAVQNVVSGPIYVEYARAAATYPTVKDRYVTDGLIAMWDGEDNLGAGVHDPAATTWADLTGNHADMVFRAAPTVGLNYYDMSAGGGCIASAADIAAALNANAATIEIVCDVRTMVDNASLFACVDGDSGNRVAWVRTSTANGMKGIVGAAEYKSTSYYSPYPAFDTALNAVRSYTFTYSADACRIHKDGTAAGKSVANKGVSGNTATAAFSIGQRISQNGGYSAATSDMRVYCVRIYDRVLSADEIAANHAQDVKRFFGSDHAVDLDDPGRSVVQTNYLGTVKAAVANAKDFYGTDGLIAMWDGEDNQGTGTHVAGATTWVDLTGNHAAMVFDAAPTVNARSYDVSAGGGYITSAADIASAVNAEACTIEIVCDVRSLVNDGTLFACVDGSNPKRRTAWARSGTGSPKGVIASMEYKAGDYAYEPFQKYDQTLGAVRSYTFAFSNSVCRIHRNGSPEVAASGESRGVNGDTATAWFSVGQRISQGGKSAGISDMNVYCVRIYNRVLTADEIAANHVADVARFWGDATALPLGSRPVVLADGTMTAVQDGVAAFPLTGLRPDVADYTARLVAPGAAPGASVDFSTASEREGSAWLEYIDSDKHPDGTVNQGSAIWLNFAPGSRVPVVKTKFQFLVNTASRFAFGAYSVPLASGTAAGIYAKDGHNQFRYRVGAAADNADGFADIGAASLVAPHELELNRPDGTFLDGTLINAAMSGKTESSQVRWILFGRQYDNGSAVYPEYASVRMWYFKLWADGTLVRDMVPARRYGRAPCMIDRTDMKFYTNGGDRNFKAGPMRPAPALADVSIAGRTLSAMLTRAGTDASAVSVAYGADYGDGDPQAWENFEQLATGFAAGTSSLSVSLSGIPRDIRYVRFLSREDGWSDTVFLPDVNGTQPFVLVVR
ncbi:MAG: hypothetical protein IJK04_01890 [Kiritimatiellae bacterium]|nr:hypothetical protein [Kiritimatiellia bacterium]